MVRVADGARSRCSWWLLWFVVGIVLVRKPERTPAVDGKAGRKLVKLLPLVVVTVLNVCECAGAATFASFLFSDTPWQRTQNYYVVPPYSWTNVYAVHMSHAADDVAQWWKTLTHSQYVVPKAIDQYLPPMHKMQQTSCTMLQTSINGTDRWTFDHFKMLTTYYMDRIITQVQ